MRTVYRKYIWVGALTWACCFIGSLLFYLLVLGPQENSKSQIEKRFAETERNAQAATEAAQEENKIKWNEQIENLEKRLEEFVVRQENITNLPIAIDQLSVAKELGSFDIPATNVEGMIEIANCEYIFATHLRVNFASSFYKFVTFLNALERGEGDRPIIFIDTFSITRSKDGSSGHEVDMELAVFVAKEAETKGVGG